MLWLYLSLPRKPSMSTELKRYTVDDVGRHHRTDDAWVIVDRRVYDITAFLTTHPGGLDVLRDHLGHDVSSIMRDESSHQHTGPAFELLEEYCIGAVDDGTMVSCAKQHSTMYSTSCNLR